MKVGIFGGGFKPFHTGHYAKVALALKENDILYLFYGVQNPESKVKKYRCIGDTGREFTPEMSSKIF